jgi:NADH:ubiquinone oxidoreductase subunit 5 (subunit L)/multisubunit Na+/H+ antiporter MnhA subunit
LNGFVSKWLIYLSLMQCGLAANDSSGLAPLLAVGLLALVGGLAAIVFVRLTGIVLLGSPRSEAAQRAHESSPWMLGPIAVLAILCLTVAVVPQRIVVLTLGVQDQILGREPGQSLLELEATDTPLRTVGIINAGTMLAVATALLVFLALSRKMVRREGPTWACGYVNPTVRMQYTGASFAEMLVENLLPRFLRPRTTRLAPQGLFPATSNFGTDSSDPVTQKAYEPFFRRGAALFSRLHVLQQGRVHLYLLYIFLALIALLLWR